MDPQRPDASPFNWKMTLDVERVYRGKVPDPLVGNGWDGNSCNGLDITAMGVGNELFISVNFIDVRPSPVLAGNFLIWRRVGDRWTYFDDATSYSPEPGFDPPAAKRATTLRAILRLVAPGSLPDTAASSPVDVGAREQPMPIVLLLAAVFVVSAFEQRRRSLRQP